VAVGNLTVGGTGKTPVAAWFASRLAALGFSPAVLLRGYGDDEPLVHARINPGVPVLVDAERRRSGKRALAQGATALVLDDAFQHRQMPRDIDVVLVSADAWDGRARLLPAGPFREPLSALRRAHVVLVTRKAVSAARAREVADAVAVAAGRVLVAVAYLAPDQLMPWNGGSAGAVQSLSGQRVVAVSGIGAPGAFLAQLRAAGAEVEEMTFRDHHAYTAADARAVASRSVRSDRVVCTLKDAVKLGPLWPANAPPLWYLSQAVIWEAGREGVEALLDRLVPPKALVTPASTGPKTESHA
jgi:tetraacyldisaccharide 4'-kinase